MTAATLFIPGVPRNANARGEAKYNRWDKARFRKKASDIGSTFVAEHDWVAPVWSRVTAQHVSPVRRRRDPTGLAERLKGILDGLVDAHVFPDDSENEIELILARSVKGPIAGIQLTIEPGDPPWQAATNT